MKKGSDFEKLVEEIFQHILSLGEYESVEHDVLLRGPDGERQIDILLKGRIGPITLLVIVECKDYSRKVTVETVDALHSKQLDVKANKAVLISRKGFTSGAISKANRLGIVLATAHEAKSEKWPFSIELPFLIEEQVCNDIVFATQFKETDLIPDRSHLQNYIGLDIVAQYWNDNIFKLETPESRHYFTPTNLNELKTKSTTGQEMHITGLKIGLKIQRKYYYGNLADLASTKGFFLSEDPFSQIIFNSEEFMSYRDRLAPNLTTEEIPNHPNTLKILVKELIYHQIDFDKNASKKETFKSIKIGIDGPTYKSGPIFKKT